MNVLIDGVTPKVCSLKEVLRAFLDHRREVLIRRSNHRLEKIDKRLEILEGLIIAFLNLDRVIDIIRYDEDPKIALMAEDWSLDHPRASDENDYASPESEEGELTPDNKQDDCLQNSTYDHLAKSDGDWVNNPLSKLYTKEPTTIRSLGDRLVTIGFKLPS